MRYPFSMTPTIHFSRMKSLSQSLWKAGLCSLLLGACLFHMSADAMQVVKMSQEDLLEHSSLVVRGRVLRKQTMWNEKKTAIITKVTIEVQEELVGRKHPTTVVVGHYGGKVGTVAMGLEFSPGFRIDEEVILFLHTTKYLPGEYLLTGWTQGKWSISRPNASYPNSKPEKQKTLVRRTGAHIPEVSKKHKEHKEHKEHKGQLAHKTAVPLHAFTQQIRTTWNKILLKRKKLTLQRQAKPILLKTTPSKGPHAPSKTTKE